MLRREPNTIEKSNSDLRALSHEHLPSGLIRIILGGLIVFGTHTYASDTNNHNAVTTSFTVAGFGLGALGLIEAGVSGVAYSVAEFSDRSLAARREQAFRGLVVFESEAINPSAESTPGSESES